MRMLDQDAVPECPRLLARTVPAEGAAERSLNTKGMNVHG